GGSFGFRWPAGVLEQAGCLEVRGGDFQAIVGRVGEVSGELLPQRQGPAVELFRLGQAPGPLAERSEITARGSQLQVESRDLPECGRQLFTLRDSCAQKLLRVLDVAE